MVEEIQKAPNQVIKLQDPCFNLIEKIQKHREEVKCIKMAKNVIVAEAVSLLAEKEFAE